MGRLSPARIFSLIFAAQVAWTAGLNGASAGAVDYSSRSEVRQALNPLRAGVTQIDSRVLQFWMELASPPALDAVPDHWTTFIWFVDADCNPGTGQAHGPVGSEYNIRAVLRNHWYHGRGFIDIIAGGGQTVPMFVDGSKVFVRVCLEQIGNPTPFKWNYGAFAWNDPGRYVLTATEYRPTAVTPPDNQVVRVVVEPALALRSGTSSRTPKVFAFNSKGAALPLRGGIVKFFSYQDVARVSSLEIQATTGRAGWANLSAMVDGVVSCNVAKVCVGGIDIAPSVIHLDLVSHTTESVSLLAHDVNGTTISLHGHSIRLMNDNDKVAVLSPDGTVQGLGGGTGKQCVIRGEFDEVPSANGCVVRVLRYPLPLLPAKEALGLNVSFWYPPYATTAPLGARFEEMTRQYDVIRALDTIYLRIADLTGVLPFTGGRQHLAAICEDDKFKLCGGSGNPIGLGFNPLVPTGCVMLDKDVPYWGVMSHEIGHNFVGEFGSLNRILCSSPLATAAAYGEGLATLCNMYARTMIVARPDYYGVADAAVQSFTDPNIYDSLPFHRRIFVDDRLIPYLQNGAHYPADFTADVLDGMLIVLAERYGWNIYPRFFSVFFPPDETLDFVADTETRRATFLIAAMTAAARTDLRTTFSQWGLPCDKTLFDSLLPSLSWRAAQRDSLFQTAANPKWALVH